MRIFVCKTLKALTSNQLLLIKDITISQKCVTYHNKLHVDIAKPYCVLHTSGK